MAAVALITGGGGLLGQQVLEHWGVAGLEPMLVDRDTHDLLTPGTGRRLVETVRPTVVVHLAWTASGTPGYREDPSNDRWIHASLELRDACRSVGARFCGTGTAVDQAPPTDAYSTAKAQLRRALDDDISAGAITWLRPYYVIDPDHRRPDLVGRALAALAAGTSVMLRTPTSLHDFIHAADAACAIVVALREKMMGEVSLGSGTLRTVSQLVEALGVPWAPTAEEAPPAAHVHEAAVVCRLRAHGWTPTKTEELFRRE